MRTRVHGRKDVRPLSLRISKSLPYCGGSLGKRCFPFESGIFLQTCGDGSDHRAMRPFFLGARNSLL